MQIFIRADNYQKLNGKLYDYIKLTENQIFLVTREKHVQTYVFGSIYKFRVVNLGYAKTSKTKHNTNLTSRDAYLLKTYALNLDMRK